MADGKQVPVGGDVKLGSNFSVGLVMFNAINGNFLQGNFLIKFRVLDASLLTMGIQWLNGVLDLPLLVTDSMCRNEERGSDPIQLLLEQRGSAALWEAPLYH